MHDGRFSNLNEVLNFYNTGFHYTQNLDLNLQTAVKGRLSTQDMLDIIAFLNTLTDTEFTTNSSFSKP
jgi:cytochrome c peroxidase